MSALGKAALCSAEQNGARVWGIRQYGYEKFVVLDERGAEIASMHRRDWGVLIAAAPDMYEALRLLLDTPDNCVSPVCKQVISAALAKAEGRL